MAGELWESRIDDEVRERLHERLAEARRLLGGPPADVAGGLSASIVDGPSAPPAGGDLRASIDALAARLAEHGDEEAAALRSAHAQDLERIRRRFERRLDALARVRAAVVELRAVTSPNAMLAAAPRVLCECSDFERVLVSGVRDGSMVVGGVWFRDDEQGAEEVLARLRDLPIRLEHPLIETEIMRRRRATVVTNAQSHRRVHRRLAETMGWDGYVAAPIAVQSRTIAVIHADRGTAGEVDVVDRDVLWEFASGLAQTYESATLRRRLRHERAQMRQVLDRLNARSAQLNDAAIELMPEVRAEPDAAPAERAGEGGVSLGGLLTRRELEVLGLLSDGLSNRAIADELVISEGTVKFHVNGVFRKLRVTNRAEAVARYLSLSGGRGA